MPELEIREFIDDDTDGVAALWQRCGLTRPWNDPAADIAFAVSSPNATILTGWTDDELVASAMVGHDGHRGTVYYVCVDPGRQSEGFGRTIMRAAEQWLLAKGVWKLNLVVRGDNAKVIEFYRALGYQTEDRVLLARWIDEEKKPANTPNR